MNTLSILLVLAGLGVLVWAIVYAVRRIRHWSSAVTKGALLRFAAGIVVIVVGSTIGAATTAPVEKTSASSGAPSATPTHTTRPKTKHTAKAKTKPRTNDSSSVSAEKMFGKDYNKPNRNHGDGDGSGRRQAVVVTRIIDGDTFEARGVGDGPVPNHVIDVRMLEINTVEEGECGYDASTNKLASLLGGRVTVERDGDLKDQYGRWLLYVWNSSSSFVNLQMVQEGWAEAVLYEPNDKYWTKINAADTSDTYHPWAPCYTPEPQQEQQIPPQNEGDNHSGSATGAGLGAGPGDIDCEDVAAPGPVAPGDPDDLDRDGDGIGCNAN